ncbi:MAG TPA: hypothetical protein VJW73_23430 [Gemmatimonadaceae bacterium]|nr:hypothetical protein [Gemmatimonadaceae bacterium]
MRFTPPSIYREWWRLTEQCSGRQGNFDAISWYVVPDAGTLPGTNGLNGLTYDDGRIILAGAYDGIAAGDLVRHEMLHALLGPGVSGHPRDMFVTRCAGVVVCISECLSDGGPAPSPDPAARSEPASTLEVTVDVVPQAPSSGTWDGYLMMIVHAHNPGGYPIVAQKGGFGYHLRAPGNDVWYDLPVDDPEQLRFAAGETKSLIFDFHIVNGSVSRYDIIPMTWTFNGSYGAVWAPSPPTITIAP